MFNLFKNIVQKRRYTVVEESDVMTVLKVLHNIKRKSRFHLLMEMEIGNCGWANKPEAWFIHFGSTTGQWRKFITTLEEEGYTMVVDNQENFHVKKGAEGQK